MTLNCSADGNPPPVISWTRVSDNSAVVFPLTNIGLSMKEPTDALLITVLEVLLLETYPLLYTVSTLHSCLAGRCLSVLNYYMPVVYMKSDGKGIELCFH